MRAREADPEPRDDQLPAEGALSISTQRSMS